MGRYVLSQDTIHQIINYDPDTGIVTPKIGVRAKPRINSFGYLTFYYQGRRYKLHRLIWCYYYGHMPMNNIDHINGDKLDNRIANLRDVPQSVNAKNQKLNIKNTSKYPGVYTDSKYGSSWKARITIDGKTVHLGWFATYEDAVRARKDAEQKHGFTSRLK